MNLSTLTTASSRPSNWTMADIMAAYDKLKLIPVPEKQVVVCDFGVELYLQTVLPRVAAPFYGSPTEIPIHVVPGTEGYKIIPESELESHREAMAKKLQANWS